MCSLLKKVLLKSLQNTKENTYAGVSFLTMLQAWGKFLKPPSSSGCFLMLDFVFGVVGRTSKFKMNHELKRSYTAFCSFKRHTNCIY